MAVNDLGSEVIHQYVGQEPSGQSFNSLVLDKNNKPHNPMINAGAVIIASLLRNDLQLPDRFDYVRLRLIQLFLFPLLLINYIPAFCMTQVRTQMRLLAGNETIGFDNSTFLSERATANRNRALAWFMKDKKVR